MIAKTQTSSQAAEAQTSLPNGWQMVRFEQMAESITDRVDNPSEADVEYYVGLEHLDPVSLKIRRWGTPDDVEATKLRFKPGDIIFGRRRAYQRKLAVADFEGICSAHALVLRAREETVIKEFLPFFMQSETFFQRALAISVGSLSPTINWKTLAVQEFAIPPKDEQRRIAEILWAAEELFSCRNDLVDKLICVRQLSIDELILNPDNIVEPNHLYPLGALTSMQNGRSFPSSDYGNEGIRLLRPGNLGSDGLIHWPDEATKFLPKDYLKTASEYLIEPGNVVINLTAQSLEDGFMGRVCLVQDGDQALLNQRIGRFMCGPEIFPEYLYRCLQTTRFRNLVETNCEGSKVKHLYWRHIENFPIHLPPKEDQLKAVERLATVDKALSNAREELIQVNSLRTSLREQFMAGGGESV